MEKTQLGKTGLMVSRVGFGGIPIQRGSEQEAVEVVTRSLDLGINFIDTATAYTTSEERIGKAIAGRRDKLVLATKSPARKPDELRKHLHQSLKRLGVDYIDLYQFHNVSTFEDLDQVLAPGGPYSVVEEAKRAGLVRHIGVTSHQVDAAKKAISTGRFETVMFPLNFITCEPGEELLTLARCLEVGFIAMKPLDGGLIDNVTIAFKYLMQYPDVVPLVGIQKIWEIEEIVRVIEGPPLMTTAERTEMQQIKDKLGKVFCRRCDYCQPCSADIPISLVLDTKSIIQKTMPDGIFTGPMAERLQKAADCTQCGDCEPRCPYHLPIREMVANSFALFDEAREKYLATH